MKKLLAILFAVVILAPAVQAQDLSLGGQLGYSYGRVKDVAGDEIRTNNFVVAPELGMKISEDVNVGVGLSYGYTRIRETGVDTISRNAFGTYVFGEKALLAVGTLKVFLRGDVGYETFKWRDADDRGHTFYAGIAPNIQYPLSKCLTLTVSSGVLNLGVAHTKEGDAKATVFGFNTGHSSDIAVGLKYAF